MSYRVGWTPTGKKGMRGLPPKIRDAVDSFIYGPLADNPQRVGKRLRSPLDDQHSARRGEYRVRYVIHDEENTITIMGVDHRRDAYRPH